MYIEVRFQWTIIINAYTIITSDHNITIVYTTPLHMNTHPTILGVTFDPKHTYNKHTPNIATNAHKS